MTKRTDLPTFGRGVYHVWFRNFLYLKQTVWVSLFWLAVEPLIFLLAIGYGVGSLIPQVGGQSYISFYGPGLMAASGMMVSYYEATYGTFTKLSKQKTFETQLLSPISIQEIVLGEILWASFKGLLSSLAVAIFVFGAGLVEPIHLLPSIPILALNCFVFASFGLLMSSYATSFDWFVFSQIGIIMPMYMFAGVLYPLEILPGYLQSAALALPLTHSVNSLRILFSNEMTSNLILHISLLMLLGVALTQVSIKKMSQRLTF